MLKKISKKVKDTIALHLWGLFGIAFALLNPHDSSEWRGVGLDVIMLPEFLKTVFS